MQINQSIIYDKGNVPFGKFRWHGREEKYSVVVQFGGGTVQWCYCSVVVPFGGCTVRWWYHSVVVPFGGGAIRWWCRSVVVPYGGGDVWSFQYSVR